MINIDEEIKILMEDGWSRVEAIRRTRENIKELSEKKFVNNAPYENRYREKMHKYRR